MMTPTTAPDFDAPLPLLGGLSAAQFLRDYWQKKPLLVRQAIPGFTGLLSRDELFELACDPDVESRYVRRGEPAGEAWELRSGPQARSRLRGKTPPWTVLVQGVNLWLDEAEALLAQFAFIPQARLDDLMVSYAVDGGGVGPHFDHYDVFLLQGMGRRHWRISDQLDRTLLEEAPLRILQNFQPTQEWTLEPGDLLYLPPHWAHDGVAIGPCMTYSVGFRALAERELVSGFLAHLQEQIIESGESERSAQTNPSDPTHAAIHTAAQIQRSHDFDRHYTDPDLEPAQNSAEIPSAMLRRVSDIIRRLEWQDEDVADFLAAYLSEPKAHVFYDPPPDPMDAEEFRDALANTGYRLDPRSRLLFHGQRFFLNGERVCLPAINDSKRQEALIKHLRRLADQRQLAPAPDYPEDLVALLHEWHECGYGQFTARTA